MQKSNSILSICIPTYNRAKDLEYNLSLLEKYIKEGDLSDKVQLLISDNHSTDNTSEVIESYSKVLGIKAFEQNYNIGGHNNTLFLVEHCDTEWVMCLGDDDYLEPWYIGECLKQIEEHPSIGCIIPNYIDYFPATGKYGELREVGCETKYYKAGFDACLRNSWLGHQLSGLCFRRAGVMEAFRKGRMDNLYPQIFFISYCALHYDVLHFGQKCLRVSIIPQSQKDWNYREDGLVNDIFENYKHLGLSPLKRAILEAYHLKKDMRYLWATSNTNLTVEKILDCENVSSLGRILIAFRISRRKCYTGTKHKALFKVLDGVNSIINVLSVKHKSS